MFALCVLTCFHISSVAHADPTEPAAEPPKGAPAQLAASEHEQDEHRFDKEADYLALADAPIFLPRSYLYWGTPVGPKFSRQDLVFALEYALHLSIYNNVRDQALHGKRWAGATTLSFEGDLRMLNTESKPVRMPSYRPNLSGQLFYLWHRPQPMLFGLRAGLFHYSNGQEQCTFDRSQSDDSAACRATTDAVTDASRSLNRINGNFASNGWLLELNGRALRVWRCPTRVTCRRARARPATASGAAVGSSARCFFKAGGDPRADDALGRGASCTKQERSQSAAS